MENYTELMAAVKELIAAPSCYGPLKELAEKWVAADGTAAQANLTALLKGALKEDVCTIDDVLPFFASDAAKEAFGAEAAASALPAPPVPRSWDCWEKRKALVKGL